MHGLTIYSHKLWRNSNMCDSLKADSAVVSSILVSICLTLVYYSPCAWLSPSTGQQLAGGDLSRWCTNHPLRGYCGHLMSLGIHEGNKTWGVDHHRLLSYCAFPRCAWLGTDFFSAFIVILYTTERSNGW